MVQLATSHRDSKCVPWAEAAGAVRTGFHGRRVATESLGRGRLALLTSSNFCHCVAGESVTSGKRRRMLHRQAVARSSISKRASCTAGHKRVSFRHWQTEDGETPSLIASCCGVSLGSATRSLSRARA